MPASLCACLVVCRSLFSHAAAALLLMLLLLNSKAKAATVVSNLSEPVQGEFSLRFEMIDNFGFYQPFTTGSDATFLNSVTLDLGESTGSVSMRVFVATTNQISSAIADFLNGASAPTTAGLYTYTAPEGIILDANTTYYVGVYNNNLSGSVVRWVNTASTNETSASGWSLGDYALANYNTPGANEASMGAAAYAARLSINATTAPEPTRAVLLLLASFGLVVSRHRC